MKTRGVIGKRIVAIRQHRFFNEHIGRMDCEVEAIVLDDGTELRPHAVESDFEPFATVLVVKPRTNKRGKNDAGV